jgi:hypothetical protein
MSAYALPGLFPPLPSYKVASLNSATSCPNFFGNYDSTLEKEEKLNDCNTAEEQYCSIEPNQKVGIAVKEAKIDAARLIHALTAKSTASTRQQAGTAAAITPASSDGNSRTRSRRRNHPQHTTVTPQEDAMQFELSISFNGRKYTAIRTLPSILQLRRDLVEEVENRSAAFEQRRHPTRFYPAGNDQDVCIPELPRVAEDCPWTAQASRGFTMLHDVLRVYAPTLEGWLRKVTMLVPPHDSPSWTNFLWEPVSDPGSGGGSGGDSSSFAGSSSTIPMKRRGSSMPSLPSLDMIEESDTEHDDQD